MLHGLGIPVFTCCFYHGKEATAASGSTIRNHHLEQQLQYSAKAHAFNKSLAARCTNISTRHKLDYVGKVLPGLTWEPLFMSDDLFAPDRGNNCLMYQVALANLPPDKLTTVTTVLVDHFWGYGEISPSSMELLIQAPVSPLLVPRLIMQRKAGVGRLTAVFIWLLHEEASIYQWCFPVTLKQWFSMSMWIHV